MANMNEVTDEVLGRHHVLVATDNPFQRRARLLQALWREERGLPIGERRPGVPLGSRLPKEYARESGVNLMTPGALAAARREVEAMRAGSGQKIDEDRLWANLLSSQPLAFSLFAELGVDLGLATHVLGRLWPSRVTEVTKVGFEYSPGRSSPKYTHDRTAFDVYVEHTTPRGGRGFIGIEVKYHEALTDAPAEHRPRYDEVTKAMGCFKPELVAGLRRKPVEQIWRDHMLAGSMLLASSEWETGLYVFLYPEDNEPCRAAVQLYREYLSDVRTFDCVSLERLTDVIGAETDASWIRDVRRRYLAWEKIDTLASDHHRGG
ncbi:MAG: hypothetical protein KF764_00935 [Labilithrix sp.]|nr:hypothetical protein [Labilithrix sp.]